MKNLLKPGKLPPSVIRKMGIPKDDLEEFEETLQDIAAEYGTKYFTLKGGSYSYHWDPKRGKWEASDGCEMGRKTLGQICEYLDDHEFLYVDPRFMVPTHIVLESECPDQASHELRVLRGD